MSSCFPSFTYYLLPFVTKREMWDEMQRNVFLDIKWMTMTIQKAICRESRFALPFPGLSFRLQKWSNEKVVEINFYKVSIQFNMPVISYSRANYVLLHSEILRIRRDIWNGEREQAWINKIWAYIYLLLLYVDFSVMIRRTTFLPPVNWNAVPWLEWKANWRAWIYYGFSLHELSVTTSSFVK